VSDAVVINDTPGSPPMTEVHIWIGHYQDGTEGMLAADMEVMPGILRHMPLMHSRREIADAAGDLARRIQEASPAGHRIVRIELRTFRAVTS
jgi:hypothetical protein